MRYSILIALFLTVFFSTSAQAVVFRPHIKENQKATVEAETVFFFGHSTAFWDGDNTGPAVREMIRLADQENIYKVATISDVMLEGEVAAMHYFLPEEMNFLVPSRAGQHRLEFPNTKTIFVLGGNLGRCLCEGIRDMASGWWKASKGEKLNLFLVRDGIYDNHPPFAPMPKKLAAEFVQRFFVPNFSCPLQNWFNAPKLALANTKLELRYDGVWMKDFDLDPTDAKGLESLERTIVVDFIDLAQVPGNLRR